MTGKELLKGLSHIDNALVDEAEAETSLSQLHAAPTKFHRHQTNTILRHKWAVAALCLGLALLTALTVLPPLTESGSGELPPSDQTGLMAGTDENIEGDVAYSQPENGSGKAENDAPEASPDGTALTLSMDTIYVNELSESTTDTSRRFLDPAFYDTVSWGPEEILSYYGRDLTPAYLPAGLTAAPGNGTLKAVISRDDAGTVAEDTLWLSFYHSYYEDGTPRLTEDVAATKGFTLAASKLGLLRDCIYLLPENEVKTSDIAGIPVTIGYRSMPCGPYDAETHAPSGSYDLYVAEFTIDGIQCQLTANQMELAEVVKVVASVITGEREIVVE